MNSETCYIVIAYGLGKSLHSSMTRAKRAAGKYRRQLAQLNGRWMARTHVAIETRTVRDMQVYPSTKGWSITL